MSHVTVTTHIWAPSGTGLSEHAWQLAESTGAAWVGNNAAAHITLLRSTVEEELAVGMEQRGVEKETMRTRIQEALTLWGLREAAGQDPTTLSTGQTRRLAIAAALLTRPDALVLDCPTDGLDAESVETLRATLRAFPGEVTVYDRVCGALFSDANSHLTLISDGELKPWADEVPRGECGEAKSIGEVVFRAEDVRIRRVHEVGPIDLEVRAGTVTHLAGRNGCGKTSLLMAAMGLLDYAGTIDVNSAGWAPTPLDESITQRTALREVSQGAGEKVGREALEFVGLEQYAEQHPLDMPASARRMLLVACAMARKPQVLLLDEPTVGLDTAGYGWLARVMRAYADQDNRAVLWTCHDAEFAGRVSDVSLSLPQNRR